VYAEQAQQLIGVPRVVIFIDNDAPGFYHAELRYYALKKAGFRNTQITFRLPRWGKDVTEHLTRHPDGIREFLLLPKREVLKRAAEYTETIGRSLGY
jgi:hypothetical protein